jgi:Iap family predicted aminopeptidase
MRRITLIVLVALVTLLIIPAAAYAITYDGAVDELVDDGYPQSVIEKIRSHGTCSLGFWPGGTWADDEVARYVAREMRAVGLKQVRLEGVPVDEWDMRGASVTVNGHTMVASQWGGVRGTPAKGLSGELVYVGTGSMGEFAAAGDVRGKILLVDLDAYSWWPNFVQMEAKLAGAKAIVLTHAPYDMDPSAEYFTQMDALGCFDGETDYVNTPLVYVSRRDGEWLRAALAGSGAVTATVKSDIKVRFADDGGRGFNVVGEIPGTSAKKQIVLVSAHHDAWFRPALDDTSAVGAALTMAKAMKMSGYRPARTIVFMITTAEEFGYTDAWYDWLVGSWWAITHAHRDWPGKIAGQVNLEWQGLREGWYQVRTNPEMTPWVQSVFDANPELAPYGIEPGVGIRSKVFCWNDQWPLTAAGVPSIYLVTKSDEYRGMWYHTNYDQPDLMDWEYLGKNIKLAQRFVSGLDKPVGGLLPYDFSARAAQLADTVDAAGMVGRGVSERVVDDFVADMDFYAQAAADFDASRGAVAPDDVAAANVKLLQVEKWINSSMTALDQWDTTVYPHQQVYDDFAYLDDAVAAIDAADQDGALGAVASVGQVWIAQYFSTPVYLRHLEVIDPDYRRVVWGGQGHLAPYPQLHRELALLDAGRLDAARAPLVAKRAALRRDLERRLGEMGDVLSRSATALEQITP